MFTLSDEKKIPNIEVHNRPIKQIIMITTTATHPPAAIADIKAFVPAIIALIAAIVALTVALVAFTATLAALLLLEQFS